jgi:hypothetical protein
MLREILQELFKNVYSTWFIKNRPDHKISLTFQINVMGEPVMYRSEGICMLSGVMQRVMKYEIGS